MDKNKIDREVSALMFVHAYDIYNILFALFFIFSFLYFSGKMKPTDYALSAQSTCFFIF